VPSENRLPLAGTPMKSPVWSPPSADGQQPRRTTPPASGHGPPLRKSGVRGPRSLLTCRPPPRCGALMMRAGRGGSIGEVPWLRADISRSDAHAGRPGSSLPGQGPPGGWPGHDGYGQWSIVVMGGNCPFPATTPSGAGHGSKPPGWSRRLRPGRPDPRRRCCGVSGPTRPDRVHAPLLPLDS
jgi:hypothetical protein